MITFIINRFLSVCNNGNFLSKFFIAITMIATNYAVVDLGFLYGGRYVNNNASTYQEQLLGKNKINLFFW